MILLQATKVREYFEKIKYFSGDLIFVCALINNLY